MTREQIEAVVTIMHALDVLPANKKEYLLGYAEGVAAMSAISRDEKPDAEEKEPA